MKDVARPHSRPGLDVKPLSVAVWFLLLLIWVYCVYKMYFGIGFMTPRVAFKANIVLVFMPVFLVALAMRGLRQTTGLGACGKN